MTVKDRKERERDEMRELIIKVANEIISEEGIDKLSVRKIAHRIEYSPSIIYHYFKDKDDIINNIMKKGYHKIVCALASVQESVLPAEKRLVELTRKYINVALQMSDEFMSVQLNKSSSILEHTSHLFKGASEKKPALLILFQCLKEIYKDKNIEDSEIELTAQIISTATFGLIIRLIIEKSLVEEQRQKLIEHHLRCVIGSMIIGMPLNNN